MKTHTLKITTEQAKALYECVELASTVGYLTGSLEHFARFALHDLLTEAAPEISGSKVSKSYKACDRLLKKYAKR